MIAIFKDVVSLFKAPDPMRFADKSEAAPPPGWFGEIKPRKAKPGSGAVCVDEATLTFEFTDMSAFSGVEISPELTAKEIAALKARGYAPERNAAYSYAKRRFAQMQGVCSKEDLAQHSKPPGGSALSPETCKDLLAIFRKEISNPSPIG